MLKKLTLALGFGAGYVLGTKHGTQRYEQIVEKARELAGMPAVQNASATVQDTAGSLAEKAKETVNEKVSSAKGDSGSGDVVEMGTTGTGLGTTGTDLGTAGTGLGTTGTGATTFSTAAPGAAPSATAPITRP